MPVFVGQITNRQILFNVAVSLPSPNPGNHLYFDALLDTGAQMTMVTGRVVRALGLAPIGAVEIVPVSGNPIQSNKFRVRIDIPISEAVVLPGGQPQLQDNLRGMEVESAELPYQPNNHDVLLGMDFIRGAHLTIHRDNFILST